MAASIKLAHGWNLPAIVPENQVAAAVDSFAQETLSPLDADLNLAWPARDPASRRQHYPRDVEKRHWEYLLGAELEERQWRRSAQALGQEHARRGVSVQWIAETHRLFARHMEVLAASLNPPDPEYREFCSQLRNRLFRDLSLQSAAYVAPVDAERYRDLPARVDHLLLTVASIEDLYTQLMQFLIEIDGVPGAWLGRPDGQGVLHPQAIGGATTAEYLSGAPIHLLDNLDSPVARAWITGEIQTMADWSEPADLRPLQFWRERGLRFGWRSSCCIPIGGPGEHRDALLLYSNEVGFFADPEIRRLSSHLRDVLGGTLERLRQLTALEEQRRALTLYKAAVDASPNGILISDATAKGQPILYANAAFERITGYKTQETIGTNGSFLQGTDTAQPQLEVLRNALRRAEPCAVELKNYRKDGSMFWNAFSIAPVLNESGQLTNFIGIQNDITTLKNAVAESERTTELYRALMSAAELVIRTDNERELLDEMCRLLVESRLFSQVWLARPNIAGDLEIESIFSTVQLKQYRCLPNVYTGDESRVLAVRAWRKSKLQYSNDRAVDPAPESIENFFREHDLHATAVVPLYRDGDLWALLSLLSHDKDIFTPELLELVERIGRLIGHGLDGLDLRQILEEERQHQSWLARHDALTDVLNRRGTVERLDDAISRARRHNKLLAFAVMDIEGFKTINDLHGHPAGDLLLRTVADRLQATLRQTDAVGRLGGDEFVLIIEDLDREDDLTAMLARVQAAVEVPLFLSTGRSIVARGSMGVTLFPNDDSPPERLMRHAERALYAFKESKEEPAQRWIRFEAREDEQKFVRQRTILSLFRAGNTRVHYQPVIDLQSGKVTGIEALARLASDDGSLLAPAEFIPQLSASDLGALTHQVMEQSVHDLKRLDEAGFVLNVGVNLEPITLSDAKAMEDIRRQVEQSGVEPRRFIFELLERTEMLSLAHSQEALHRLKSCGVRIALDDVGSAYSSLLRVKELPVDVIKLDRSFLIGLERQPDQLRFLMSLVHLVQGLGLELVVEGVECHASGDALAALGVQLAQGYDFARPMGVDDLLKWVKRHKATPWSKPLSVLGAVALQLSGLDATARILKQRPAFLHYMVDRDPDTDCAIGNHLNNLGPIASRATAAHRAWHRTMASLCADPGGKVDPPVFEAARSLYEQELFDAALEAHQAQT